MASSIIQKSLANNGLLVKSVKTETQTIDHGNRGVFTISGLAVNGYTLVGIIGVALSNNWMAVGGFSVSGNTAQVIVHNLNVNSEQYLNVTFLYAKNEILITQ